MDRVTVTVTRIHLLPHTGGVCVWGGTPVSSPPPCPSVSRPCGSGSSKSAAFILDFYASPVTSSLTFAILPGCVPGQAEEGREENDGSGHSSISEPHLISAAPLLSSAQCRGLRGRRRLPPPSAFRVLTLVCTLTYGGGTSSVWKTVSV